MIFHTDLNRTDDQPIEANNEESWRLLLESLRNKPNKGCAGRATDTVVDVKCANDTGTINSDVYIYIKRALERNKNIDNSQIHLQVKGNLVILSGKVKSWIQKEEAGRIASTFDDFAVVNDIAISYF